MHDGYVLAGSARRACCTCGYTTAPYPSDTEARHALLWQHATDLPVCRLCDRRRWGTEPLSGRWSDLEILTVAPGDQILVCSTDTTTCRDQAAQRQLHLDRAAYGALGLTDYPAPTLRSIAGRDEASSS